MIENLYPEKLNKLPPIPYLLQIARTSPSAVYIYLMLWNDCDYVFQIKLLKSQIREKYLIDLTKFRRDLFALVRDMLASFQETDDGFLIELVGWQEYHPDMHAC